MVCKLLGSSFYLTEDTFDGIPVSMAFVSEIEVVSLAGVFQRCCIINKIHCIVVFLAEFGRNARVRIFVLVGSSFVWSSSFV